MNQKTIDICTLCRDCCWAEFDEEYSLQIGCKFNRLFKYKELNKASLIKDKETNLQYYKISTLCNRCRTIDYMKLYENPEQTVIKQTNLVFGSLIIIENNTNEEILKTVDSLINQSYKPSYICIVFFERKNSIKYLIDRVKASSIKVEITNVLGNNSIENMIDNGVRRILNTHYYNICKAGFIYPDFYLNRINYLINEELYQISMIKPKEGINGLTIQTELHKILGGNFEENLTSKIDKLAKDQHMEHMIYDYHWMIHE